MQGNTFLEGKTTCTEWETTASCGTLCLYIRIWSMWNMWNTLERFMAFDFCFYVLHTKTQVAQSDPYVQITAGRSIWYHMVIALKSYEWKITKCHGFLWTYKEGPRVL